MTKYIVHGTFSEDMDKLWSGNGWVTPFEVNADVALKYECAIDAQAIADAMHYADCGFKPIDAKAKPSRFTVRNEQTGELHTPPPFVRNRFIFAREKEEPHAIS